MFEKGYFSLGVRIVSAYPLAFILGGAVLFFLSGVTLGILSGPCLFGLAYMTRRAMRGEEVTLADIFSGFEERIGSAFIAGIALLGFVSMTAAVFLPIGAPIFNIPGFVVFAILGWMFPILVDDETARFRDAFVRAFEFSEKELLQRGLFALVLVAVGGAGFLPFVPGVAFPLYLLIGLVTGPWAIVTLCAAYYREMHPEEKILLPEEGPAEPTGAPPVPPVAEDAPPAKAKTKKKTTRKKSTTRKKTTKRTTKKSTGGGSSKSGPKGGTDS